MGSNFSWKLIKLAFLPFYGLPPPPGAAPSTVCERPDRPSGHAAIDIARRGAGASTGLPMA